MYRQLPAATATVQLVWRGEKYSHMCVCVCVTSFKVTSHIRVSMPGDDEFSKRKFVCDAGHPVVHLHS